MTIRVTLIILLLQCLACGPLGPIPGGRLTGEIGAERVGDWAFAAGIETAQLESGPTSPRSVNTWFVALDERLYVPTSMIMGPKTPTKRSWVTRVAGDPNVRIRIGGIVYEREAGRVTDRSEYDHARAALEAKYGIATEDRDPEREIWIFRLDPRTE